MTNGQKIAIGAGVLIAFAVGYYIYRKIETKSSGAENAGSKIGAKTASTGLGATISVQ